jgi:ADP-heptose:LPS heptosyltransferase
MKRRLATLALRVLDAAFLAMGRMLGARDAGDADVRPVCLLRTDAIGDLVLFLPYLASLQKRYGKDRTLLVLQELPAALLAEGGRAGALMPFRARRFRWNPVYRLRVLLALRRRHCAVVINTAYSRDAISDQMAAWSGAAERVGWAADPGSASRPGGSASGALYSRLLQGEFPPDRHEHERNQALLERLGISRIDDTAASHFEPADARTLALARECAGEGGKLVAVLPAASQALKEWPAERFAETIATLHRCDLALRFVLVGAASDAGKLDVAAQGAFVTDLCGGYRCGRFPRFSRSARFASGTTPAPCISPSRWTAPPCVSWGAGITGGSSRIPMPDDMCA